MRYPCLVKKKYCRTEVTVILEREGVNKYGEPIEDEIMTLRCNYQDTSKSILDKEKKLVQLSGVALFPGDIAPHMAALSGGTLVVNGERRKIYRGRKNRNPDGTVNYSELDVI